MLHLALSDGVPERHQTAEHTVEPATFGTRTGLVRGQILIVEELLQIADVAEAAQTAQVAEVAQITEIAEVEHVLQTLDRVWIRLRLFT